MQSARYHPTLIVLLYHNLFSGHMLSGWQQAAADYMTTHHAFRRDIDRLVRDPRIRFTSPDAFFQRMSTTSAHLDVFITFDDGYHSTRAALEHLAASGIPAAVFVNSGLVGTGAPAWPEQLLCFFHFLGPSCDER